MSSVMVHPLTVGKILTEANISHVDYFSFYEYSGIKLMPVTFWKIFKEDFKKNRKKYNWIYGLLNDLESKNIFEKIVNFRFSANLSYMKGFKDRQKEQYFEDFLDLKKSDEIFYDVGGYDGFTTLEFIKRCPDYRSVYIFEPESKNMKVIKKKLAERKNINFIQKGLSNKKETVKFSVEGSASKISEDGEIEISVDLLDHILDDAVTFMKMDIEGGEKLAIEGARQTILKNHPRLAVSVYHVGDDLWRIPEQIMSIRDDYKIYLRCKGNRGVSSGTGPFPSIGSPITLNNRPNTFSPTGT